MNLHRTNQKRSGLSLIEVLWSMGIVAVGLLGVLLIVPVAGQRVTQGGIADAGDRVGRNATRSIDVLGLRQPGNWLYANGNPVQNSTTYPVYPHLPRYNANSAANVSGAFCIDPIQTSTTNTTFPYVPQAAGEPVRMPRISLRTQPGGGLMGVLQAQELFVAADDLVIDAADDVVLPQQNFGAANEKRQTEGKYSWMVTLIPKLDGEGDKFVASVVVMYRRVINQSGYMLAMDPLPDNERVLDVQWPNDSFGYNGGEIELLTRSGRPVEDLSLSEGDWIMLMGYRPEIDQKSTPSNTAITLRPIFRWYRITSIQGEAQPSGTVYSRFVSLDGRDWDLEWERAAESSLGQPIPTQAVVVNNVVTVHEKSIRLEASSLWDY